VDDGTYHHMVTGWITLSNKGGTNLQDVSLLINMDCEANVHTAYLCDANGMQITPPVLSFPDLAPGQTSPTQAYHWTLNQIEPAPEPTPFTVTPKLNPQYTVTYVTLPTFAQTDTTTVNLS
jgi:hypothetical protein